MFKQSALGISKTDISNYMFISNTTEWKSFLGLFMFQIFLSQTTDISNISILGRNTILQYRELTFLGNTKNIIELSKTPLALTPINRAVNIYVKYCMCP